MPEVTIRDVAHEAGLSVSSVSRILRGGQGHVYPTETHERVREIAERLGYRANIAARLLRQTTRTLIGMSVYLTEHPYLNRFLLSVHDELLNHDYDPIFLNAQHLSSERSTRLFPPPQMLAGLISMGVDLQMGWPEFYATLRERIPIVSVQPVSTEATKWIDVIHVDFFDAYKQACEHLIQLGHRNIAYLGILDNPLPSDARKNQGWIDAATLYNLPAHNHIAWKVHKPQGIKSNTDKTERDDFIYQPESQQAMIEVVERLTSSPERITALICSSDEVAIGLQSFLQSRGWKLPQDLSIIGYDGISMGGYVYPPLTTIAPEYSLMAQAAVECLLKRIACKNQEEQPPFQEVFIKPKLVVRASTTACTKPV